MAGTLEPQAESDFTAVARQSRSRMVQMLFEPVLPDMERAAELLHRELRNENAHVDELLAYIGRIGGKQLRPAVTYLAAQATGEVTPAHDTIAAVVEMIHLATLVHDDILDEADTRRHQETANRRWGNHSSVLLGDYLFTHAFYLASTLETTEACRRIGLATNRVCEGELRQVHHRGNFDLPEAEYLDIISGKTAELISCATYLGARYAGATDEVSHTMESYGRELGVAFQIADDLLDIQGAEAATGKSLGTDLEQGKATLPIIHLLRTVPAAEREELMTLLRDDHQRPQLETRLEELMQLHGSMEYAKATASGLAQRAASRLDGLPDSPAKQTLRALADFVVARTS